MKKLLAAGIAALALTTASFAEPVKIGMITTLSGGGAGLGVDARDGFMLAINLAGNKDVTVVTEDDAMKPELAVQIADKMIQQEQVDILTGIIWSNLAMAVVPNAVAQGKFYLSVNAGPSPLAGAKCNENYFNVAYQNDNFHEAMGEYATKQGLKKIFILAPNYPAGTDSLNGFKRFYKGELAGEVYTKLGQTDYAAEIAQIRELRRQLGVLLPARRYGHRFRQAVCAVWREDAADGSRLLLQPGRPGRDRRRSTGCEELGFMVEGSRQRRQQDVR